MHKMLSGKEPSSQYATLAKSRRGCSCSCANCRDMNSVSKAMGGVVKGMNKALTGGAMDVDKLTRIMDQFEKNSDDLEVRTSYMEGTMSSSTATSTPEDEVDGLIKMVADEHGLQLMDDFNGAGVVGTKTVEDNKKKEASNEVDDLAARLAALHR